MAIITKALVIVALVCAINALPVENGQEQEAQVADLLSVDDVPQQDAGVEAEAGQVRDKRHGFYGGFGIPVASFGYGFGYPSYYGGYGYPSYYGGYGYGHRHHHHYGYWG